MTTEMNVNDHSMVNATAAYTTGFVTSKDGTTIGYRKVGHGPAIVVLHGSNVSGQDYTQLAAQLSDAFTVYLPDRRGRGLSGPFGSDYSMRKEVEDLSALLTESGAHNVFGISAGGLICLEAARTLPDITKVAVYEPGLLLDGSKHTAWLARYDQEMAQGKVAAALVTCMKGLELGGPVMNAMPRWLLETFTIKAMESQEKAAKDGEITMRQLAPTLHYDGLLLAEMQGQLQRYSAVQAQVLLLEGSNGLPFLKASERALAKVLPYVVKLVEFPKLDHGGANNPSQTARASNPALVAQELRSFFA
ncbi:MAG TPA: alpha/beta hydrolase [Ktedonobacterales bacterium]